MENKIKVSIIIPVYNNEKYLNECLDSIINQSLKDIEIICINDGSTDNSLKILEEYQNKDNRIKIINQKNAGQSEARNKGVELAKGDFIYFIDSDDYLEINALEKLYEKAIKENLDIVYFNISPFLDKNIAKDNEFFNKLFSGYLKYYKRNSEYNDIFTGYQLFIKLNKNKDFLVSPCLQIIKTDFYQQKKLNFKQGIIHEDELFSFVAILLAERAGHLNQEFYKRRIRENSTMTVQKSHKNIYGYLIVYLEKLKFLDNYKIQEQDTNIFINNINTHRNQIIDIYNKISENEKNLLLEKLTFSQKRCLDEILENYKLNASNNNLKLEEQKLLKKISSLENEKSNLDIKINKLSNDLKISKLEEQKLLNKLRISNQELSDIKKGYSFRIGRIITYLPRKIKNRELFAKFEQVRKLLKKDH